MASNRGVPGAGPEPNRGRPATQPGPRPRPAPGPLSRPRPRSHRVRAYVGLGANVGNPAATLAAAVHALAALPGTRLAGVSRLYATDPVGVLDQPEFRNAVAAVDVPSGPDPESGALALLVALKGLEAAFGRRDRARWGPRELDLDLLVFGRHVVHVARPPAARSPNPAGPAVQWLTVPHASARERLFVLAPLADLAAGLRPPGWSETVATARDRALEREGPDAVRPVARWEGAMGEWRSTARAGAGASADAGRRASRSRPGPGTAAPVDARDERSGS